MPGAWLALAGAMGLTATVLLKRSLLGDRALGELAEKR
jgi:hypothetical protein